MFKALFKKNPALEAGRALYAAAVEQARAERLYTDAGVPDTVEGRFEMVALHVYLLMRRLKADDAKEAAVSKDVSQSLLDAMFQNMDDSLRELGVGDLVVGKKIRKLAESFYGRIGAYETAFGGDKPGVALAAAMARNIFESGDSEVAQKLAIYVRNADNVLQSQSPQRIAGGIVSFPAPEFHEAASE
jgi:cytochrome b pre-mRNA-processing protein 3